MDESYKYPHHSYHTWRCWPLFLGREKHPIRWTPCDCPDFAIEFSKGSITEGHWEKWIWMTPKSWGKNDPCWILSGPNLGYNGIILPNYMSDDLNLGWLIHYVSGHRMPKPCKAMGNLKSDTLSLIHHMNFWIIIWICLISITAAPPKYYHILLLSSKYSKRSRKVLQRITASHYQPLQRMDLLQPATCFSQIRCPSER